MKNQNYKKHARLVFMYHYVALGIIISAFIGSILNLFRSVNIGHGIYIAIVLVLLCVFGIITFFMTRGFALRAQDRAIRAEENLRHFVLTGKLLDPRIRKRQVIALRFAPDEEFVELAKRAANENLAAKEIKKAIQNWNSLLNY